jgi:predicted RNase H-like HicB family nuclease
MATVPPGLAWDGKMKSVKFVYWQDNGIWLGYLQEYPEYWTQGTSLNDLKHHLKDLYRDLTGGEVPGIRKVGTLVIR